MMFKMIGRSLLIVIVVATLIVSAALYFVYTESGTQIAFDLAKRHLPGDLQVEKISGTLSKHVELNNIVYHLDDKVIKLKSVSLNWEFAQFVKTQTTTLTIAVNDGVLIIPNHLVEQEHPFKGGTIVTNLNDQGSISEIFLDFIDGSQVKGQLKAPTVKKISQFSFGAPLKGKILWTFPDIHILQDIIPKIGNLKGKLSATITLDGTILHPNIATTGEISESGFNVPDLESHARDLKIQAKTDKHHIHFTAEAKVGDGNLKATGSTDMHANNLQTIIKLTGDNARIIDMPLTKITASPNVELNLSSDGLMISGDIFIPSGSIKSETFSDMHKLSEDVVFISPTAEKQTDQSDFDITSNVNITLGDNIWIAVDGLKARVTGDLKIKEDAQKPTTATGQLKIVDGKFVLYGKTFNIEYGALNYHGGPITDPGLDIRATRSFGVTSSDTNQLGQQDIKFGVAITGTASRPKYSLYSEPAGSSQADILSYLFTGQPLSSVDRNGSKAQLLLQAAALINIDGHGKLNNLRNQIKSNFGLSEFDIQTISEINKKDKSAISHTALILGKSLSPKLYLKYSFDILDHTNKLNVRYLLNKNWSIQSESSHSANSANVDSGVDILYSIERN